MGPGQHKFKCMHALTISIDYSVANKAKVSKKFMVVGFTVGQSLAFIVAVPHEGLFTLGAHKMFNMPVLPQGSDNSFLNGPPTSSTDWNTHFVMAPQAVKLILVIQNKSEYTRLSIMKDK